MKLGELLEFLNEGNDVTVYTEHKTIAVYDGRNSIPVECNDLEVIEVTAWEGRFGVFVKGDEEDE